MRLDIGHSAELGGRLQIGASLAVSGVCLTVVELDDTGSVVEVSPETLSRTTLGQLRPGDEVNLEAPLRIGDPLGGHWVQGHVDSTARVVDRRDTGEHRTLAFSLSESLSPFLVEKGSVAVDGVSLTVAARRARSFEVAVIPHTLEITTLASLRVGDLVNVEVDLLAKYVQQALGDRGRTA